MAGAAGTAWAERALRRESGEVFLEDNGRKIKLGLKLALDVIVITTTRHDGQL